ncbi:hypothetical protein L7F22_056163 [Adiantum nelumboides]|nr:hypothetical protein [Adiantum nelumboides]
MSQLAAADERALALLEDITSERTGSVNQTEVFDLSVRKVVESQMERPNPALAMQFVCSSYSGRGRVLPPAAMASTSPMVEFFSGELPLVSPFYIASEGLFGINMNPLCSPYEVSYTILPNTAYYEFLPFDAAKSSDDEVSVHQSQLVDLVDVKVGQEYEVVITTFAAGLYRHRVGDRLQVTGFYNKTPQFRAVQEAKTRQLEAQSDWLLKDYTSCTDLSTLPAHYVLFWELSHKADGAREEQISLDSSVMEACCDTIEECLDVIYKRGKCRNWIGPLEIRIVRQGTVNALLEYSHDARGVPINQYKTPRIVKLAPMLELLNSRVSQSFFATKMV